MIVRIFNHLRDKGLNPYFPGQHKGECEEPYVVIRQGSQTPTIGTNRTGLSIIDILIYTPASSYTYMESYSKEVKAALKELNYLRKTGFETPVILEDDKKAYMISIEYVLLKKLEG